MSKLTFKTIATVFAFALTLGLLAQASNATIVLDPEGGDSATLDQVFADNDMAVQVGDKLIEFVSSDYAANGGASTPGDGDITLFGSTDVNGNYGLRFQLNGFQVASNQSINGNLRFRVTALDPDLVINDVHMGLTGGAAAGTGSASIVEGVTFQEGGNPALDENLFVQDTPGFNQLSDDAFLIDPSDSIFVTKDIGVAGGTNGGAHISEFTQHFSQIPEPASLALFAIGGALLATPGRRRRQNA